MQTKMQVSESRKKQDIGPKMRKKLAMMKLERKKFFFDCLTVRLSSSSFILTLLSLKMTDVIVMHLNTPKNKV